MTTTAAPRPARPAASARSAQGRVRDRVLGLSGISFTVLLLLVVLPPHATLDYDRTHPPSRDTVTAFFEKHYTLEQYQALMHSLAAVALLVFFAALAAQVRYADTAEGISARLTLAAGASIGTIMLMTMALVSGSVSLTGGVDGVTQGWMYTIGWWGHFKCVYLLPVALVPACRVLRRARVLPAALAWSGQVLGLLGLVAVAGSLSRSTEFLMFPAYMLLMLWVLATGTVALTRGLASPVIRE